MFDLESRESEQKPVHKSGENNLGYVLGWFCGGILILGVVVAAVNVFLGHRRKAFQAVILPSAVIAWLFLIMDGLRPMLPDTEGGNATWVLLLIGGIIFIPLLGLRLLRSFPWPPRIEAERQ